MAMTQRDRRALVILGLVAVVGAAIFLVGGKRGGGTPTTNAAAAPGTEVTASPGAATQPVPSPLPTPSPQPSGDYDQTLVFSGRDPFDVIQGGGTIESSPAAEETSTSTTTKPPKTPKAKTPEPSVSPAGSPSPGPGSGSSRTFGDQTVVLIDIFTAGGEDKAQVEVDGTVYTVGLDETFAESFQLVYISGNCADFLYGDQRFTLCATENK